MHQARSSIRTSCRTAAWAFVMTLLGVALSSTVFTPGAAAQKAVKSFWPLSRPAPRFVSYLPDDCVAIMRVSLAELSRHPASRPIYEAIKSNPNFRQAFGVSAAEVRDMMLMWHGRSFADLRNRLVFFMRRPMPAETLRSGSLGKSELRKYEGVPYGILPQGNAWSAPNGTTLVFDSEASLKQWFDRRLEKVVPPPWLDSLPKLSAATIAVAGDPRALFAFAKQDPAAAAELAPYESFASSTGIVAGITLGDRLAAHAIIDTPDIVAAARVQESLEQGLAWTQGFLDNAPTDKPSGFLADLASSIVGKAKPLATGLVKNAKIARDDARIDFKTSADFDVTTCRTLLAMPDVSRFEITSPGQPRGNDSALRDSARNLQALLVAMHRYHRKFGHFPAATILGPDGRTPHSWRVAVLPFLDEQDLYAQYKLDEPWDSPHNRKLLEQAPDVLRGPTAKPDSTSTSYFVLTGDDTMFANGHGTSIDDVTDGASQTMMIVETQRDVPWTRPLDIRFDPSKPFPLLGGIHKNLFLTTFVDGSIRGFPPSYDQTQLKAAVTKSGGEEVTIPEPPKAK